MNPIAITLRGAYAPLHGHTTARALSVAFTASQPEIAIQLLCEKLLEIGMDERLPVRLVAHGWIVATLHSLDAAADAETYEDAELKRKLDELKHKLSRTKNGSKPESQ